MLKITNKNEAKTMAKRISCKCKCKFNSTACNSNEKNGKLKVNMSVKNISRARNTIVGILAYIFVRIASI